MTRTASPLLLAVAAVVTSFIFALWLSQRWLTNVEENVYEVAANAEPSVVYLEDARTELDRMAFEVADHVAAMEDHLPKAVATRTRLEEARNRLHETLVAYERLPFFPDEQALYEDAKADLGPLELDMLAVLAHADAGDFDSAAIALRDDLKPRIDSLSSKLKTIAEHDTAHARKVLGEIAQSRRRSWSAAVGGATFSVALSVAATAMAMFALWRAAVARQRIAEERGARIAAEKEVRRRDEFLVVVSHELRNPLTALQLAVAALKRKPAAPSESLQSNAMRQVTRMVDLVDELILVGELDLGSIAIQSAQFDLLAFVRERLEALASSMERSRTSAHLHGDAPVIGWWDPAALGRVVDKLLSNAIRFGGGHPIDITVSEQGARARLTVTDRGVGVRADLIPAMFDRLRNGASGRRCPGLGLGLYIARSLVEAMGGTIAVASTPSEGTTFTVDLPFRPQPTRGVGAAPQVVKGKGG